MIRGEMVVFSGNANKPFAENICGHLGIDLGDCEVGKFKDGEINVKINESVRGKDVYLVQPTSTPVNDNLMEALILIDALKRASAYKINVIMPYYGYARQDRKTRGREPITAKLVADLITTAGADRLVSMDLHAGQIQGYFDIPVDHLTAASHLAQYFREIVGENKDDFVVVSPDLGGVTRARSFSNLLDLPIGIIEKMRPRPNESMVMNIIGEIKGKSCIIIDDMIDTAGTITNAAEALIDKGAKEVYLCASHGVFSGPALERINKSSVKKCVVTDSIYWSEEDLGDKIDVVSVSDTFAEAIKRINTNSSVSDLF